MILSVFSVSAAAVTVLGACLSSARAQAPAPTQGTVAGAAMPGTMEDTFTVPYTEYAGTVAPGCGNTYAGCSGEFFMLAHEIAGTVTVIDDCTFRIEGWQFDGEGPAVEWCASLSARCCFWVAQTDGRVN
ncbi:MAG: DM13 domain-containing protein [Akkermansiaceae bacterium]|nr:DM13 domain-containing protein [Akkermansiaceae bacterium]